jgi:hypothetical protein
LIATPGIAEVRLPNLPPGTYDFVLFDEAQQVVIKPRAVTILAPPPTLVMKTEVQALGAFVGLSPAVARSVKIGSRFEPKKGAAPAAPRLPVVEVLALRPPEAATQRVRVSASAFLAVPLVGDLRVPAIIHLPCTIVDTECKVGDTVVGQDATITLPAAGGMPELKFVIDEVRPADAPAAFPSMRRAVATVRVRFAAAPEVLAVMKAGDIDVPGSGVLRDGDRAVLTQVGSERQTTTAQASTEGVLRRSFQIQVPVLTFTGTVRVPVVYTAGGWSYKERPVKVGAPFNFESVSGAMAGWILDMKLASGR